MDLSGMTQEKWNRLCPSEKERLRDKSGLTPQLINLERYRVEVVDNYGERRRFWVGRSTGWRPCHLELKTRWSISGDAAPRSGYKSVRVVGGPR